MDKCGLTYRLGFCVPGSLERCGSPQCTQECEPSSWRGSSSATQKEATVRHNRAEGLLQGERTRQIRRQKTFHLFIQSESTTIHSRTRSQKDCTTKTHCHGLTHKSRSRHEVTRRNKPQQRYTTQMSHGTPSTAPVQYIHKTHTNKPNGLDVKPREHRTTHPTRAWD